MKPSVFTRIFQGEIPAEIITRDDVAATILTHEPFSEGHMLVIPLQQVDHLWDLDDQTYTHVMSMAKNMAHVMRRAYPHYLRIATMVEGFEVPHAHVHVAGLAQSMGTLILDFRARENRVATPENLAEVAKKLRSALEN